MGVEGGARGDICVPGWPDVLSAMLRLDIDEIRPESSLDSSYAEVDVLSVARVSSYLGQTRHEAGGRLPATPKQMLLERVVYLARSFVLSHGATGSGCIVAAGKAHLRPGRANTMSGNESVCMTIFRVSAESLCRSAPVG